MNKKTIIKLGLMLLVGGVCGALGSLLMLTIMDNGGNEILINFGNFLKEINWMILLFLTLSMFLPSFVLFRKTKKRYQLIDTVSEEEIDKIQEDIDWNMSLAVTINGAFVVLNMIVFGSTFNVENSFFPLAMAIFLFNAVGGSVLEIKVVKIIQKYDPRIKGDPTSLNFHKDYLASCDEAEQLRIYKASYYAFQTTKGISWVMMILAVLGHMLFDVGIYSILLVGILMLVQVIAMGYQSMRKDLI